MIDLIDQGTFDVLEESHELIEIIYKVCKKLTESNERQILCCAMRNLTSGQVRIWNVYNYDDKEKLIGFQDLPKKISKFIATVAEYRSEKHNFSLEILIDSLNKPNLEKFQQLIIKTKDVRKIGIILEDKMDDLIRFYVKESNLETSYETALFFYGLFEEGHDLSMRELNNAAYVFIAKSELEKANNLLNEARTRIKDEFEDLGSASIALYNLAIIQIYKGEYKNALLGFKSVINFYKDKNADGSASVLHLLQLEDTNKIRVNEIREGNVDYPKINSKDFAENNINVIVSSGLADKE